MIAKFLYRNKIGHALMGKVLNVCDIGGPRKRQRLLEIKITSYENKKDKKFVGHCFLVDRKNCQIT